MKKLVIAFLLVVSCSSLFAQRNIVKVNPLGFFYNATEAGFERALNNDQISAEFLIKYTNDDVDFSKLSGLLLEFKYKFFFPNDNTIAPFGWYSAPLLNYQTLSGSNIVSTGDSKVIALGGGVVTGVQWFLGDTEAGISFEFNLGSQYSIFLVSENLEESTTTQGFRPRAAFSIGFCF